MSKFRNRLMKRAMAVILSGAMVMSCMPFSDMTVYASESSDADAFGEPDSEPAELTEPNVEETKEAGLENAETVAEEGVTNPTSENQITENVTTEDIVTEDDTTEDQATEDDAAEDKTETETTEVTASTEASSETETTEAASETEEITETKTESAEEETTEESVDNAEAAEYVLDLSGGLTASKEGGYGDDVLKLSVLCEMPFKSSKKEIGGVNYDGCVAGGQDKTVDDNPKNKDDNHPEEKNTDLIPVKGAVFKMQPSKDAKITFVIDKSDNKVFQLVRDDGANGEMIDKSTNHTENGAKGFAAGAYTFTLKAGETYYFFGVSSKLSAYAISWKDKNANRPAWADVAKPVITAALSETDKEKIQVTVDAAIGNDADKLTVTMYDKKGDVVDKKESVEEKNQTVFEFEPEISGEYTFQAAISRDDDEQEPIMSDLTAPVSCEVAMKLKWNFTSYGNGMSANADTKTEHDDGSVTITSTKGKIVPNSNDGLSFYYTTVNPNLMNFTFTVNAHVDKWKYTNGQEGFGIMVADDIGDITSKDIVENSSRFWNNSYQAVISKISYKWNGVEVSEDNSGQSITMQIGVGATEKVGVTPQDVDAIIKDNTAQQPARYKAEQYAIDTTYARYGEGQYNMVANWDNDDAPTGSDKELYEDFWLQIEKNNTGYAVRYAKYKMNEDRTYQLDDNGKKIVDESTIATKQFYDTEALSVLEENKIYIGMFAARNATITFSDIDLKTWPVAEDDSQRDPKPVKYINLSNSILSGSLTNTPEYSFMFASNWSGKFRLKDSSGNYFSYTDEQGNVIDTWEVKGTLDPDVQYCQDGDNAKDTKVRVEIDNLSVGKNDFIVEYTPSQDWTPEWDKYIPNRKVIELKSYNMVEVPFSVEYKKYGQEGQTIYVSQDGKSSNIGTKESPLDIYTAVKYAQPGQTILLNGGRYSLNRTLQITKGINGEPDLDENGKETYNKYIKMMGDPADSERPVLDFNGTVAAVVAVGNYWYFKDFDVIRCKDGEKGIQVSGSWCVYDRVDTYRNGSTGLQICRAASTDTYRDWPHDNLILNCNSYLNVDKGYEDADGFAAKLTSGSNNVFDGCIAAFNADDGWDLFAKAQTGSIGGVIIKNSIAYRNGYVLKSVKDGTVKTPAEAEAEGDRVICVRGDGNGNGFKMGGDGLPAGSQYDDGYEERKGEAIQNIGHRLYNSLSFGNKSKGIDSNSAPNIKAYNSISFNNDGSNISLYTYNTNKNTDYELQNVVSFRTGTDPSKIETDEREFPAIEAENIAKYNPTRSINFMSPADPGSKSSSLYFSLKNAKSMKAEVKVWWRSSDPEQDEMMIMSEKGEAIGREYPTNPEDTVSKRIYEENGLIISKLQTKGTEKCYLGVKSNTISIYKAEITVEVKNDNGEYKEETYTVDIGDKYTKEEELSRNGNNRVYDKPVEIRLYYRAVSSDSVDNIGAQDVNKIENDTVFKWDAAKNASLNKGNKQIKASDFESLEYPYLNTVSPENWRNANGTIKTDGFLKLKPNAGEGTYTEDKLPSIGGTDSTESDKLIGEDTDGTISSGDSGVVNPGGPTDSDYGEDYPAGGINAKDDKNEYIYFRKIWAADINYLDYTDKEEIVYTGKAITPEVHVRYSGNSELLRKGKDYRLKYENNINAGEATVHIIGAGNYAGYDNVKTFTIKKISLNDETVFVPSCVAVAAGKDAKKEIKPTWLGKALKEGKDYTIENDPADSTKLIVKAVAGGNFADAVPVTVIKDVPAEKAEKLMSKASIKITTPAAELVYDQNNGVEPECEVKLGGTTLTKGTDYNVEYANHKEIGKATLTVVGINDGTNGYFGSKSINYTIKGGNLKDAKINFVDKEGSKTLESYVESLDGKEFNGSSHEVPVNRIKVEFNGRTLKNGTDYTVVQKGMEKAGTATVTIKGINGYTGSQIFKFKVLPLDISDPSKVPDSAFSFPRENEYKVGGVKLDTSFKITINGTGVNSKNYSLSYKNNKIVANQNDAKAPTLVVTGRNGLKGKREFQFNINPSPMAEDRGISVSAKDIAANGKDLKYSDLKRATISVTQTVGVKTKKLAAGRDYNRDVKYYIDENQNYKIDIGTDTEIDITSKDLITNHKLFQENGYMTVMIRVEAAKDNPKCYYGDGSVDGYFRVGTTDINKAKVIYIDGKNRVFGQEINESNGIRLDSGWDAVIADIDNYIAICDPVKDSKYNPNKYKGPNDTAPRVLTLEERKASGIEIMWIRKSDTEYLVRPNVLDSQDGFVIVPNSYKRNNKVGTASFVIRGTGKYAGTKRVSFKILSKQQSDKLALKAQK